MSITAECTSCGKKYQAPAHLAGKRVRCKQCGNIFQLPGDPIPSTANMHSPADMQRTHHSLDATAAGDHAPGEEPEEGNGESVKPLRVARTNVRFSFPLAREIDRWAPTVLTLGGLGWLAAFVFHTQFHDTTVPSWVQGIWLAVALLAYWVIVHPITLAMIRSAGKQFGYQMPINDARRGFAAYLPPFVLAYVLWAVGDGQPIALFLGCIAAIAVAAGTVWLLFRLRPTEIAPTAGFSGLGLVIGICIAGGIFFGLNMLLVNVMVSTKKPDALLASPFGPGFAWISPQDIQKIHEELNKAAHPVKTEPEPAAVVQTPPPPPVITSPIVKSSQPAPIAEPFDDVLRPLVDSHFMGIVHRHDNSTVTIEVFDTNTWKPIASPQVFNTSSEASRIRALSPDGQRLARIVSFPSLCIQVWINGQSSVKQVYFNQSLGTPQLLGFASDTKLLMLWQRDKTQNAFEMIDVSNGQRVYLLDHLPVFDQTGCTLAVSQDGAQAAITAKVDNIPTLFIYDIRTGQQRGKTKIASLDPRWPVTPTGLAFSPDEKMIAVLFEQGGSGLLQSYDIASLNGSPPQVEQVYPAGPISGGSPRFYDGSAIAWLPNSSGWVIYGQAVFSPTGQFVADLGVSGVRACTVRPPDALQLVLPAGSSQKQITVLHLDTQKLASMMH